MARYPDAEWVPWRYPQPGTNRATYYLGRNRPEAVVLHIMQGYARTARQWAIQGMYPKSWHFTVGRDGSVMQHLEFDDGGYHAGITAYKAQHYPPTWPLWKGPNVNVNNYTIGIEHEGFYDQIDPVTKTPFTPEQREASRKLCWWLADELEIPVDPVHFPPHAVIDLRDRRNDFAVPAAREIHYAFLAQIAIPQEDQVSKELESAVETLKARNEILNDVLVIQRDLARAVNGPHPRAWQIHKLLEEHDLLIEPEYEGTYEGYA